MFFAISRYLRGKYFDGVSGVPPSPPPPAWGTKLDPTKINLLNLSWGSSFFYIKSYLRDKMFDIVLSTSLRNLPKWTTQNHLFWAAWARMLVFLDVSRYLKDTFLHGLGVPTPKWTIPKIPFWNLILPIDFSQLGSYAELVKCPRVWNCREWTELCSTT